MEEGMKNNKCNEIFQRIRKNFTVSSVWAIKFMDAETCIDFSSVLWNVSWGGFSLARLWFWTGKLIVTDPWIAQLFRNKYCDGALKGLDDVRVYIVLAEIFRTDGVADIFTILYLVLEMSQISVCRFLHICAYQLMEEILLWREIWTIWRLGMLLSANIVSKCFLALVFVSFFVIAFNACRFYHSWHDWSDLFNPITCFLNHIPLLSYWACVWM